MSTYTCVGSSNIKESFTKFITKSTPLCATTTHAFAHNTTMSPDVHNISWRLALINSSVRYHYSQAGGMEVVVNVNNVVLCFRNTSYCLLQCCYVCSSATPLTSKNFCHRIAPTFLTM